MINRKSRRLAIAMCVLSAIATAPAAAQSYPKLLVNGHGLALTRLAVQQKSGTSWVAAATYQQGAEYRLLVRLTNYFPPPNYGGYVIGGCHVNYLVDQYFRIELGGAQFTSGTGGNFEFGSGVMNMFDPARLENTKSRTYYVYFKWIGPPGMPVSVLLPKVNIRAGQVCVLPNAAGTPIRPTS